MCSKLSGRFSKTVPEDGLKYRPIAPIMIKDLDNTTVFYTEDKSDFWNGKYMGSGSLMNRGTYQYTLNVNGETLEGQILLDY